MCPLLDLTTVLSFEENQVFKGRGIIKEEEKFLKEMEAKRHHLIL
jgi:hypothetical protein